jgi:hypothetical protein
MQRAIGWGGKMRYELLRGAKSRKGLKAFLYLNAVLWAAKLPGRGLPPCWTGGG